MRSGSSSYACLIRSRNFARMMQPPRQIVVMRIAGVDDDVAVIEQRGQVVDDGIGAVAGLDHDDDRPWLLEALHEVFELFVRDEVSFVTVINDQLVGAAVSAVVNRDGEAVASKVPGQVATHHAETSDADIRAVFVLRTVRHDESMTA